MGIEIETDLEALIAKLEHGGERAEKNVARRMEKEGRIMRDLARSYAPVDKANLEKAIVMDSDNKGWRGRKQVYVYIDPDHPGDRPSRTVGDYAMMMHEGLAPYGSGAYNLGPKSLDKASRGNDVGGKFMERAFEERNARIIPSLAQAADEGLSGIEEPEGADNGS